jgi:hypothetical protein
MVLKTSRSTHKRGLEALVDEEAEVAFEGSGIERFSLWCDY